jgi:hypothetical protein
MKVCWSMEVEERTLELARDSSLSSEKKKHDLCQVPVVAAQIRIFFSRHTIEKIRFRS